MALPIKLVTSSGNLRLFEASDALDIDTIEPRSGGNLVIGATLGASDELRLGVSGEIARVMGDLVVDEDAVITGNLIVNGTTTSVNSEVSLLTDNHIYLNDGYTTTSGQTGGLVVNYLPTATTDSVSSGAFTAGDPGTSNPTVVTTGSGTFSVGDIIQISGTANDQNDGLFEVLSHSGTTLTIRGVGTTATVEDFTQDDFVTATDSATITQVTVSVIRSGTDGIWEVGSGSTTPISFTDLGTGGSDTLQQAYAAGNTVAVTSAEGIIDFSNNTNSDTTTVLAIGRAPGTSTAGIGLDIDLGVNTTGTALQINQQGSGLGLDVQDGGGSVLQTTGAGAVSITPTSGQSATITAAGAGTIDINSASGAITLDSTGAGISLDSAGASNFSTSSGNLTLDAAAGELVFDDTGNSGLTLSQVSDRTLNETASGEIYNGVTSIVGGFNAVANWNVVTGGPFSFEEAITDTVTIAAGDCVAADTTAGRVTQCNANADTNSRFIGIALVGGTGDVGGSVEARVALPGSLVTDSGAVFTAGDALFLPDGTGRPTATAPSGTGDVVQRVGWAITSTTYVIDPGPAVIL